MKLSILTPEEALLFSQFARRYPHITRRPIESAGIDEINGKRVLCLQMLVGSGDQRPAYCHFYPEGLTDAEAEELTRRHNMDGLRFLDEPESRHIS